MHSCVVSWLLPFDNQTLSKASGVAYSRESMKLKGKVHSTAETAETMRVKKQVGLGLCVIFCLLLSISLCP